MLLFHSPQPRATPSFSGLCTAPTSSLLQVVFFKYKKTSIGAHALWRSPRLGGREPAASWGLRPRRLLRPFGPSPAPSALPPGIPQGFRFAAPLALRAHPPIVPPGGGRMAPRWCSTTLARNKPHWCTTAARSSRKPCNGRALNKRRGAATLSHPPRPFPLGRGASRPLSSGLQGIRPAAFFPAPHDGA